MIPVDSQKPRILLLDDEEIVLVALKQTLLRENYDVHATTSPGEALKWIQAKEFSVILSDQRMPEMTGLEFFNEAKTIQPNVSRILLTAVVSLSTVIEAINRGEIYRFLTKPWVREELLVTLRNAIQRYELVNNNHFLKASSDLLSDQLKKTNKELQQKITELEEQKSNIEDAQRILKLNFDNSLQLCFRTLEMFHPMLGRQTLASVEICKRLIANSNFSREDEQTLLASAWLQNIGLISVPRETLRKHRSHQDTLTTEEKAIIENHPILGQTLVRFDDTLKAVGPTIRAHHERFDGKGYPDGISGDQIPWPAHCLAVVANYVESNQTNDKAIDYILENSGKAFHPEAVRLFAKAAHIVDVPREVRETLFNELKAGMKLANNLHNATGDLLVAEGKVLDQATLDLIRKQHQANPITQRILVHGQ